MRDEMDLNQLELRRETLFKDAVLSQAEAKGMELIAEAGRERAKELEEAYKQCEEVDYSQMRAKMQREADREYAAAAQSARRELLEYRAGLVEELFGEVEQRLAAFAKSVEYPAWLCAKLGKRAETMAEKGAKAARTAPVIEVREADLEHEEALKKTLPGAEVRSTADIRLGGARLYCGAVVWDDTLDEALREQKEAFTMSGKMTI